MNYYKAQEQDTLPYVTFEQVAGSLEQLQELGLENDPLVVSEDQLTNPSDPDFISFEYGICHKRIVNGLLEDRAPGDISTAQSNLSKAMNIQITKEAGDKFLARTFTFNGDEFPLNPTAITIYQVAISKAETQLLMSVDGPVSVSDAQLSDFEDAMNNAILAINSEGMNS